MSRFLGFESYLIPLGSTRTDVHTTIRSALTSRGWQIVHDSLLMPVKAIIGNWGTNDTQRTNAFCDRFGDDMAATADYRNGTLDWIGLEFDLPVSIRSIKFYTATSGDYHPKDYSFEWSDDGTTWTSIFSEPDSQLYVGWQPFLYTFADNGLHKFWRLACLTSHNWRKQITGIEFRDQYGNVATPPTKNRSYFHCIPPATEVIGDTTARGLLRFDFYNTEIWIRPVLQSKIDFTQTMFLSDNADSAFGHNASTHAGMNPAKITFKDTVTNQTVTIQQNPATLSPTNTARQNFRYLYTALKESTDPLIQKLDFQLNIGAAQNAEVPMDNIIVTCKDMNTFILTLMGAAQSSVGAYMLGFKSYAGDVNLQKIAPRAALPVDLTSGFIYYLQVNARGIALATKTNTAVSSPVHACYANHDKAMAVKPLSAGKYCSAIELVVGFDEDANNIDSWATPSHVWCISDRTLAYRGENWGSYYSDNHQEHPLARTCIRYDIFDSTLGHFYGYDASQNGYESRFQLLGSNIWWDNSLIGNDFQIHRLSNPKVWSSDDHTYQHYATRLIPQLDIEDWFKFRGTAVNEALVLVADTQTLNTLMSDIKASDAPTTLTLGRTDGFNTTGFVAIGDEIFQYTGITGNTLTGVSRARYGTVASDHYTGDTVYQCLWFTIMNGGALLCGYNKPS